MDQPSFREEKRRQKQRIINGTHWPGHEYTCANCVKGIASHGLAFTAQQIQSSPSYKKTPKDCVLLSK